MFRMSHSRLPQLQGVGEGLTAEYAPPRISAEKATLQAKGESTNAVPVALGLDIAKRKVARLHLDLATFGNLERSSQTIWRGRIWVPTASPIRSKPPLPAFPRWQPRHDAPRETP